MVIVAAASRAVTAGEVGAFDDAPPAAPKAELVNVPVSSNGAIAADAIDFDTLGGRSGDLRLRIISALELDAVPSLVERLGEVIRTPGIHGLA
ncbi:MAG TPA: hypothetical protein VFV33_16845, partial [Gemmatimonadaceae bacterium]|nr:hypothetical protein [Gemmatimonadaceae bacterium]